jgi:hypothetical protein
LAETLGTNFWKPTYATGAQVSDEELSKVNMTCVQFHGEWNYTIQPDRQGYKLFKLFLRAP